MTAGRRSQRPSNDREIARLREIVRQTGDSLLLADDGPCSPDAELLDLCSEALHLLTHADQKHEASFSITVEQWGQRGPTPKRDERERLFQEAQDLVRRAKPVLSKIRKLRATTGPGIYAKALAVRASRTGAPLLAMSLAEDLVANAELRATLWPSQPTAEKTRTEAGNDERRRH
jgi:hypothetical protein